MDLNVLGKIVLIFVLIVIFIIGFIVIDRINKSDK